MKNFKTYVIIGISCLLIGRYVLQPNTKTEVKEVIKYVEKKKESTNTSKKTTTVETKNTDGSSVTTTTVVENTSSNSSTDTTLSSESSKKVTAGKRISLGVLAVKDVAEFRKAPDIGILLTVPLIGNVSVAATADSSKRIGIGLSLEF
jgi:hypothetical protein